MIESNKPPRSLQFPLAYLFYGMTLLAASLGTFGHPGLAAGLAAAAFWAYVFRGADRARRLFLAGGWLLLLLLFSMTPAVTASRVAVRRMMCSNNLKQISLALLNYEHHHRSLPPACTFDASGEPMHSWRVLILPYLGYQQLYDQYRLDEPWDRTNNRRRAAQMPREFACPEALASSNVPLTTTGYLAVVDERTAWPQGRGRTLRDIVGGLNHTVLLLETHGQRSPWMEPRDLTLQQAIALFDASAVDDLGHVETRFFYTIGSGRHAALADGTVQFVGNLSAADAEQLLAANGDVIPSARFSAIQSYRPNYGNWARMAVFVGCLLLPLPWVWRWDQRIR